MMEECNDIQVMHERRPRDCSQDECTKTAFQRAEVSVPIEIKPETKLGEVELECCGEPTVICKECECHDKCEITIIQKLCIKIPVTYKVKVCKKEEEKICCEMHDMCCG